MTDKMTTHEVLKTLTPREREVLLVRFGLYEKPVKDTQAAPPPESDENGSGGAPVPALIPS